MMSQVLNVRMQTQRRHVLQQHLHHKAAECLIKRLICTQDVSSRMDTIKFVKIDTEKYPTIATKHNIQGLPTLVLFKDGQPVDRIEGYMDAMQLEQRLRYHVSS